MKVCVYAIAKNEEKFVYRWIQSMSEADEIYVLDTGSTDNTFELLKEFGVHVSQKIYTNFRFDQARNDSLNLVAEDADICVCTDLDEVFTPGWRKNLESIWQQGIKRAKYRYVWNYNSDGSEGYVFYGDKIHSRHGFWWSHPVHEVLSTDIADFNTAIIPNTTLEHHADITKSRGQYLRLLELSVEEDPQDDRNMHYLGREYMFAGMWQKSIDTLKKHLQMPRATWVDERCASMRFIARCYTNLNKLSEAEFYYKLAICECPNKREPYMDLAKFYYQKEKWLDCASMVCAMLNIHNRDLTYISDPECWGYLPHDMVSICYYYLNDKKNALAHSSKALIQLPNDERLIANNQIFGNMN